jgi:2-iminobutanoate/2-iminopropanoate deaminase
MSDLLPRRSAGLIRQETTSKQSEIGEAIAMQAKVIRTSRAPEFAPLSQAVRAGSFLFVSGQIALEPGTKRFVGPEIKAQTRQVLDNLRNVLEAGGSGLDQVLKVTAYLCDMRDFDGFNEVYMTYFEKHRPARSTVQVGALFGQCTVEVDVIALADAATES